MRVDLTRLSSIESARNTRPKWPNKAGNSQADWLGIGVTFSTWKSHIPRGSNYGVRSGASSGQKFTEVDIDIGSVVCWIGVPLIKPGKFVILRIAIKTW